MEAELRSLARSMRIPRLDSKGYYGENVMGDPVMCTLLLRIIADGSNIPEGSLRVAAGDLDCPVIRLTRSPKRRNRASQIPTDASRTTR